MESLNLKELIHTVRQELIDSEKERIDKGLNPLFKVDNLKIEVNFVVEKKQTTGGSIGIKIVEVGHDVTYTSQQVHKILLELKTCNDSDIEATETNDTIEKLPDFIDIVNPGKHQVIGSRPGIYPGVYPVKIPFGQKPVKRPGQWPGLLPRNNPGKRGGPFGHSSF